MRFLFLLLLISLGAKAQYTDITGNYDYKNNINVGKALTIPKGLGSTNSPAKYDTGQIRYNIADSSVYVYTGSQWIKVFKTPPVPGWEQTLLVNPNLTQGWNINLGSNDFEWDDAVFYGIASQRGYWAASDSGVLSGKWRTDKPMNYLYNVNGSLQDLSFAPKKYIDSLGALKWSLAGNSGTVEGINFIGTTDNTPLEIRVNNIRSGLLTSGGKKNTFFGQYAGINTIQTSNTGIGYNALGSNTDGYNNVAIGAEVASLNTTGDGNIAIGNNSMGSNTTGSSNTAIGGGSMGTNTTGVFNTTIGYRSNVLGSNLFNSTAIGTYAAVNQDNSLVLGSINGINGALWDTKVGVGTTTPSERLHVVGNLRLVNGSEADGKYLKSDADGVATWADVPAETGTVQSVSVVNANGFNGTVANPTTTPAITIKTTVNGLVKGNGTAISAATPDVDYATPAYADAKVEDQIVNGVVNKAPSQNAVYDALVLKQDNLGYTPENVANKENVTIDNNTTKYPTVNLLKTGLDTKINISDTASMLSHYVLKNSSITGATKTKITYDAKGLVTAGGNATTDDILEGGNIGSNQYFTDERAQDAIGSMVDATLVYNDGLPSLGRAATTGDITIPAGSNTAAITGNVIVDADINTNAAINANKIADGTVSSTEFQFINSLTSNAQDQLNNLSTNKVTKGGDAGAFAIGTTDNNDLTIKLNNTDRWVFDGANGYLRRGSGSSYFGLQLYGTGAGSTVTFGDLFDVSTPYGRIRERNGTDTDQGEVYFQKGVGIFTGTADNTPELWVDQTGRTVIGGETAVTGNALTVIGSSDISSNLNVQGNGTFGSFVKYKTASTPSTPSNGTEFNLYFKSNKLVIQYNDAGTTRYKYLDLSGTGVTWVHTTSAP